ncbi:MAG TPA: MATE family efflux transporter, partial [Alphaproteobacteria bacterium]|nr:MATE family efflux transporter [Alphaproteobacteria bacterium]
MPLNNLVKSFHSRAQDSEVRAWMTEARELVKLGTPLIITQLAQMAIITTDIIMVGQLGAFELASTTMGVTMFYFGWLLGFGPAAAVAPIIAQALGRNPDDIETPRYTLINGLWAAVFFSVPVWLLFVFVEPLLVWIGQDPKLAKHAAEYTHAIQWGLPFAIGFMTLRSFVTALSSPRAALVVTVLMIAVNAGLNYVLIFGKFGAPALGIEGSGYASSIANAFGFVVLLGWVVLRAPFTRYHVARGNLWPSWMRQKELIVLGLPIGMTAIFEGGLFNAGVVLMGYLGPTALAAHQVAINFASITFMTALGFAQAGTVRVGLAAGAGDAEGVRRAGYAVMALATVVMSVCAVIMAVFPGTIASLYLSRQDPAFPAVVAMASSFLLLAALFQVFDALQVAGAFALRGLKDAQMPMLLTGISYWVIGFPACYALAFWADWGGMGIWAGYVLSLAVAAVLLCTRFWR